MGNIKVKTYKIQTVEHFDNNNQSLGFLNEHESTDLRCQIAENEVEGYYLMFKDKKIFIDRRGHVSDWERGLYDTSEILLSRLFKLRNC